MDPPINNLTCELCLDVFSAGSTGDEVPVLLLCGHTFHRGCLNEIQSHSKAEDIPCPLDRSITPGKVSELKPNFILIQLLERRGEQESKKDEEIKKLKEELQLLRSQSSGLTPKVEQTPKIEPSPDPVSTESLLFLGKGAYQICPGGIIHEINAGHTYSYNNLTLINNTIFGFNYKNLIFKAENGKFKKLGVASWPGYKLVTFKTSTQDKLFGIGRGIYEIDQNYGSYKKLSVGNWMSYEGSFFNQSIYALGKGVWKIHEDGTYTKIDNSTWVGYKLVTLTDEKKGPERLFAFGSGVYEIFTDGKFKKLEDSNYVAYQFSCLSGVIYAVGHGGILQFSPNDGTFKQVHNKSFFGYNLFALPTKLLEEYLPHFKKKFRDQARENSTQAK